MSSNMDETVDRHFFNPNLFSMLKSFLYVLVAPIFGLEIPGFEPPRENMEEPFDRLVDHYSHMPLLTRMVIGIPAFCIGVVGLIAMAVFFVAHMRASSDKDPVENPIYPFLFIPALAVGAVCAGEIMAHERALKRRAWMFPEQPPETFWT